METPMRSFALSIAMAMALPCAACTGGTLDAGFTADDAGPFDGNAHFTSSGQEPGQLLPNTCPNATAGTRAYANDFNDCVNLVVGLWAPCPNPSAPEAGADASADPWISWFPYFVATQSAGIEFAWENGVLRFYALQESDGGPYVRSHAPNEEGTVTSDSFTVAGSCAFHMAPDSTPGEQSGWDLVRYQSPDGLVEANTQTTYVPTRVQSSIK
jgi:hypothetical protein